MKNIFKKAQENKYALGSFNFSTTEVLKAIVAAAKGLNSPIIVSTSEGEADFLGMAEAAALVDAWRHGMKLPIILNLDHGKSLEKIKKAVAAGYDAVHFDGSGLTYEENVRQTKAVVSWVREVEKTFDKDIIVEGELGYLRGSSELHEDNLDIKPEDLTNPEQAVEFIEKTGINSLAVAIGNAHGIFSGGQEKLDLERLAQIRKVIGDKAFLVLHGGSGIVGDDITRAIDLGIVKINVNTELRLAYKSGLEKELEEKPQEAAPYKLLGRSFEEAKKVVEEKIKLFGSENKI